MILLVWRPKRAPEFIRDFEILIVAAVQTNELLFVFGGKVKLKKNQPIRSCYSSSPILIGR